MASPSKLDITQKKNQKEEKPRTKSEEFLKDVVETYEETVLKNEINPIEKERLDAVFALLQKKGVGNKNVNNDYSRMSQTMDKNSRFKDENKKAKPKAEGITKVNLYQALLDVKKDYCNLTSKDKLELEQIATNMVWEVDENLDGVVDENEFYLMYKRCAYDKSGLEPKSLFNLVEFLMHDKTGRNKISIEDTLELLYVKAYESNKRQGKTTTLDIEIEQLFGTNVQNNADGEEQMITWDEYIQKVNERAIKERKEKEFLKKNGQQDKKE